MPDRDCVLQYSEETIAGMYKSDMLEFKKHKDAVAKWLKDGAEKGKLELEMGDAQCRFCGWSSLCWERPHTPSKPTFNLPKEKQKNEPQEASGAGISLL